jgi:hypothetical protein
MTRLEGLGKLKKTIRGLEPQIFWLVAYRLNHLRYREIYSFNGIVYVSLQFLEWSLFFLSGSSVCCHFEIVSSLIYCHESLIITIFKINMFKVQNIISHVAYLLTVNWFQSLQHDTGRRDRNNTTLQAGACLKLELCVPASPTLRVTVEVQ